ncbi:hypothetical protein C2G38_2191856 [Gigaspora rosea]|uniref:Uncharacterized protein n=1 Tax=Gigaspora rosea TaxID=44941 RepID=A0A397V1C9_9GLOM|nr:hypothetical protein C2G38_2191856 [Gigaspora rosea]
MSNNHNNDFYSSIINLLKKNKFDVSVLQYRDTNYSTVKISYGEKKEFFRNLIIWHVKISNIKGYEDLYNTSETFKNINDEHNKWLIALMNDDGTDNLKIFSNQSEKFINMAHIYEDDIIDHLKKQKVAHLSKINLETPLFPKDGIEERNGLIMLSKESAVQEAKYFIKTRIMKAISKESLLIKIMKNRMNNILQIDDELKIIKELEEIIYEIDHKKLNLNYQFMCYARK